MGHRGFSPGYAGLAKDVDFETLVRTVLNDSVLKDSQLEIDGCGIICIVCFCTIDYCGCYYWCCG